MGFFARLFGVKEKQPEDDYKVTISNTSVKIEHPSRETEIISWNDILEIQLINTDKGPWAPDVWLALIGEDSGCLIPQGAVGFEEVYDIVSKYNNFNFENVSKSMACTDNVKFDLWKK